MLTRGGHGELVNACHWHGNKNCLPLYMWCRLVAVLCGCVRHAMGTRTRDTVHTRSRQIRISMFCLVILPTAQHTRVHRRAVRVQTVYQARTPHHNCTGCALSRPLNADDGCRCTSTLHQRNGLNPGCKVQMENRYPWITDISVFSVNVARGLQLKLRFLKWQSFT